MITIEDKGYREARCNNCRNLLFFEFVFAGRIAIKCSRCKQMNFFTFKHLQTDAVKSTIDSEFVFGREVKKNG